MANLKDILAKNLSETLNQGGTLQTRLTGDLAAYRTRLFRTFIVILCVLVALIALGAYFVAQGDPTKLKAYSGALGITSGAGIALLCKVWSQWSRATLLSLIFENSPAAVTTSVVNTLAKSL